jgi:hypothetical protein
VNERDFSRQVIDLAHLHRWRVAHFRPARTEHGWRTPVEADGAGFPDLVLVRGDRCLFAELKADRGYVTPAQHDWLAALSVVEKVEAHLWRPDDFDTIVDVLR